jgi:hypothetical protein
MTNEDFYRSHPPPPDGPDPWGYHSSDVLVMRGRITKGTEWLKHLRPYGKRAFWKNERREAKQEAMKIANETG